MTATLLITAATFVMSLGGSGYIDQSAGKPIAWVENLTIATAGATMSFFCLLALSAVMG